MSWQGIEGHDEVVARLRRGLEQGRLASTFLFVGPEGVGKRTFALKFAQALLCQTRPDTALEPCGTCPGCRQVLAGTHPDLLQVRKPPERRFIPVDTFIGDKDHRMREGLCHDIGLKPFMGGRRIAIIDDADALNVEGANCLLKTLEEPPPRSVLILIGTSAEKQLPTIRSRAQIVRFAPLTNEAVIELLLEKGLAEDRAAAERMARYSEGSLSRALQLADAELWSFRTELFTALAEPGFDTLAVAQQVTSLVDAAGREAPLRRERARQVIGFALDFYRAVIRGLSDTPIDDPELAAAAQRAAQRWPGDLDTAADCADRCLDALRHVDDNINQATLIEVWIDDLGQLCRPVRS